MGPPDTAERRPRAESGAHDDGHDVSPTVQRQGCPWLLAAARTGSHAVVATVIRLHPPTRCPSARRGRAA